MAGKSVLVETSVYESQLATLIKWLSCNGELWGVGPTLVFASAAALFLYQEMSATVLAERDDSQASRLEKTLIWSMVVGLLSLMVHLWVCSMRLFQYYLDSLIRDTPNVLLEMTTGGLLGGSTGMVPLVPLTVFLRQQQPQIHITVCWFLSLCYADYVRKNYCTTFNMPYLEQWQLEVQARARHLARRAVRQANSFVGGLHQRLRSLAPAALQTPPTTPEASRSRHSDVAGSCGSEVVGTGSQVSWGPAAALPSGPHKELRVHLITKARDVGPELEHLRNYISATRCSCSSADGSSRCITAATTLRDEVLHGNCLREESTFTDDDLETEFKDC